MDYKNKLEIDGKGLEKAKKILEEVDKSGLHTSKIINKL